MKKISLWLVVLSMIMTMLPGTMVSAEDAWVHVEAEAGMGITQHSAEGYGASNNCALIGHNHDGGGANLNGSNSITVAIPAAGEYDVFAVVGRGDVNDPSNSRGSYTFSIGDDAFFESAVGSAAITPISESFKQLSLGMDTYAQKLYWINSGTVTLPAGDVVLNLEITGQGIIDCVRFVPSDWEWAPTGANLDAPVDPGTGNGGNGGEEDEEDNDVITTEWFDVEVEEGEHPGTLLWRTENERTYMYTIQGTTSDTATTSNFTLAEDGTYDIWAVVGMKNANYLCNYIFALGSDELYNQNMQVSYGNAASDAMFTTEQNVAAGNQLEMRWVKLASDKVISAGEKSLTATIGPNAHTGLALGMIDVVRFVPSDWEWTPTGANFDAPEDMSTGDDPIIPGPGGDEDEEDVPTGDNDPTVDGYVHAEAENATYNEASYDVLEREEASSGKALVPLDTAAPADTLVTFDVTIPEDQEYDVYALVAYKDYSSSAWEMLVDGVAYTQPMLVGSGNIYNIQINLGYPRKMQWIKMAGNVELTAGDISVIAHLPGKTHSDSWLTAIDAIRLVPSDWFWAPDASLDAPEINLNTPNEDGALLMEAELGSMNGTMNKTDYANASGGAYAAVKSTGTVGSTTVGFATEEDTTYDIWAAVATNPVNWLGGYVFTLDDTEIYNACLASVPTSNPDLYGETIVLHTGNSSGSASTVRWVKVGHRQSVSAGGHTITAATRSGTGAGNTTGLIDCIALIPSNWEWTGSDELALPEKPENLPDEGEEGLITTDWFDIEVEDGTSESAIQVGSGAGRSYMQAVQGRSVALSTISSFTTTETKTFDIWAVVGTHSAGGNLCTYKFTLDGNAFASVSAGNYDASAGLYTGPSVAAGHTVTMQWAKVASNFELEAGDHTLVAEIAKASLNTNKFGAIDVVCFIPSEWGLSDTSSLSLQLANAVKNEYFTGDYTAVTENITLPDEIPTIAGITIGYESDDESVIANDGTVTRPYFNEEDATVNFNVVASFANGAQKVAIPVTVLKNAKYTASNVTVTEELTASGTFEASADVVINAAADSEITGTTSLVIALYNADGSLADIAMDGGALTPAGDTLATSITLPENISGMSVKVYLMNGFGMGNQLTETVAR